MSKSSTANADTLIRRLAAKDLHVNRGMMLIAIVAGIASLLISSINRTGFSFGSVAFITTVIAYGVILAMFNIAQERKDRSVLFVLSLPLTPRDYIRAKLLGTFATFLIPWTVLTVGALLLIRVTLIPDGLMPMTLLLLVYFVCTFSIVSAVALISNSEVVTTFAIVVTNMSVTFFMFILGAIIYVNTSEPPAVADWNWRVLAVLAVELAIIAIALSAPSLYYSRKRDFL